MSEQATLGDIDAEADEPKSPYPADWQTVKVEDVANISGGSTPRKSSEEYWGGDTPWVSPKDFDGPWIEETEDQLTDAGVKESTSNLLPPGSILLVVRSGILRRTLPIAKTLVPTTVNQDIKALEPQEDSIVPEYLFQVLHSRSEDVRGTCMKTGTTVESIQTSVLKKYEIPLPPEEEQRKIAAMGWSYDDAINKTESLIDQSFRTKKGAAQNLFHRGTRGANSYKSTTVGEIPEHWEVASIGDVVEMAQYGISESLSEKGEYPIFRMNNMENGYMVGEPMKYIDLDDDEFEKYRVEKDDILFNRTNSHELVGKTSIFELDGDYVFASYLVRLRANERADPYYLNYYMNTQQGKNRLKAFATKGVSQSNINATNVQRVKLPLPPLEEQKEIAEIIRSYDDQVEQNREYKNQLQRSKKGLMQDLITGKIRTAAKEIDIPDAIETYESD